MNTFLILDFTVICYSHFGEFTSVLHIFCENFIHPAFWYSQLKEKTNLKKAYWYNWFHTLFYWFPRKEQVEYKVEVMRHKNTEKFHAFSQFKSNFSSPLQTDESILLPLKTFFGVSFCYKNFLTGNLMPYAFLPALISVCAVLLSINNSCDYYLMAL